MNLEKIINFIFEIGQLKRQKHSGWKLAGVNNPDTVAEHVMRATQIGYLLAVIEGVNPEKVASMLLFHDNGKTRVGDQHRVTARYSLKKEGEEFSFCDQVEGVGGEFEKRLLKYCEELKEGSSLESKIVHDANLLEMAFQAKEYIDTGYKSADDWINNVERGLKTENGMLMLKKMKKTEFTDWWKDLKVRN